MRKEIRENVKEFKNRVAEIFVLLDKCNTDQNADHEMMKVRGEIVNWLESLVEISADMSQADQEKINNLICESLNSIILAARRNANLGKCSWTYKEDMGQLEALAEMDACAKIRRLEKFSKKCNRKSFLNVVICKFKKPKLQAQENTKTSEEPAKD